MGALTIPAELAAIQTGIAGLGLVQGIANSHTAAANARAHAQAQAAVQAQAIDAQARAARAQAQQQRELLDRRYAAETRQRTNLLERATAKARASFGARGLSPTDGSAGALLDSIETGFGVEEAERAQEYGLQRDGLDRGLAESLQRLDYARERGRYDLSLLDGGSDVQRRILGLLNWGVGQAGGRGRGRGTGGGDFELLPVEAKFEDYDPFA